MGIAPSSSIISIKYTDDNKTVSISNLVEAIKLALDQNPTIISISGGTILDDPELKNLIDKAVDRDIIIIASAGNINEGSILFPAKYAGVIAVSARDKNMDKLITYLDSKKVLYAPGVDILGLKGDFNNKKLYIDRDGSSVATAMVTGIVAIIKERYPSASNSQIVELLSKFESKNMSIDNILKEMEKMR